MVSRLRSFAKTMLAERLPTILPRLEAAAALVVTTIHSAAGTVQLGAGLLAEPPNLRSAPRGEQGHHRRRPRHYALERPRSPTVVSKPLRPRPRRAA